MGRAVELAFETRAPSAMRACERALCEVRCITGHHDPDDANMCLCLISIPHGDRLCAQLRLRPERRDLCLASCGKRQVPLFEGCRVERPWVLHARGQTREAAAMAAKRRSRRGRERRPNIGHMGRGSGEIGPRASVRGAARNALEQTIAVRLRGWDSIRIARCGYLAKPAAGFPAGTSYVVIQADDATNREIARDLLCDCSGTTDLAWDFGWTGCYLEDDRRVTELTLYPAASSAARAS
jgi:hypothetical protein